MGRGEWHNAGLDLFCLWLNVGPTALAVRSELRVSTINGEQLLRCEASSGRGGRLCSYVG